MNLINITDLKKSFGTKEVLKGINLKVQQGERIAIMGENGCGKTTLVELIAQFTKPNLGKIEFNLKGNIKKEIGVQLQTGNWPNSINAYDMIKFYRGAYPNFTTEWEKELIEVFGLSEFIKRPLSKLSGGQLQRFNAMISLMNNPKIIILDELTTGLDLTLQIRITEFFKDIINKENKTLLLVSHHPEEVEQLCDRLIIIKEGVIFYDEKVTKAMKDFGSVRNLMEKFLKEGVIYE